MDTIIHDKLDELNTTTVQSIVDDKLIMTPNENNEVKYEPNEIVWAKSGRFAYWPGWIIDKNKKKRSYNVCFGYDDGTSTISAVSANKITKFISGNQFDELQRIDENIQKDSKSKSPSRKSSRKKRSLKVNKDKLMVAIARAEHDLSVWNSGKKVRHCLCRMLDDGRYMIGCEHCTECWIHPECIGIEVTKGMEPPAFTCPLINWCDTCRTHTVEEKKKLEIKRKRIIARYRGDDDVDIKRLKTDPEETETDVSSSDEDFHIIPNEYVNQ